MTAITEYSADHRRATDLYDRLMAIDLGAIPVMCEDRCTPRKDQARLARKLFNQLRLKRISVTTPSYSMAQSVKVRTPQFDMAAHDQGAQPHVMEVQAPRCELCTRRRFIRHRLLMILDLAFPAHHDKSDLQTDYYDYCWSVS